MSKSILLFLVFFSSFSHGEEGGCIDFINFSPIYSSLWVEQYCKSGVFSGIVEEEKLIGLQKNWASRMEPLKKDLKNLISVGPPESGNDEENKEYLARFFELNDMIRALNSEPPYYFKNMKTTEELLIAKYMLEANESLTKELKASGRCLNREVYLNVLVDRAKNKFQDLAEKSMQSITNELAN